jgi:DNA-binding transcriptional LysR family regulator
MPSSRATGEPKAKLSKRVAQLERDLGVRLIERSTRSIQVTEIGRDVFAQCEVIAGGLEATEAIVARRIPYHPRTMRIRTSSFRTK